MNEARNQQSPANALCGFDLVGDNTDTYSDKCAKSDESVRFVRRRNTRRPSWLHRWVGSKFAPDSGAQGVSRRFGVSLGDDRGAIYVEFLIAFLPVHVFFLCLVQLTVLFTSRLVVEHAAVNAARAAAVVVADAPDRYDGEETNVLEPQGAHAAAVRRAVVLTLAPLILTGVAQQVDVMYPDPDIPGGDFASQRVTYPAMGESSVGKMRVRVQVRVACRIGFANRIACSGRGSWFDNLIGLPTGLVQAEAVYPYQGARYAY